jgi:hypothetical protein
MIFIDAEDSAATATELPAAIGMADLLAACAAEAARQAATLAELDTAIGATLELLRSADTAGSTDPTVVSMLARELQMADLLRQESEGLARVLALVSDGRGLSDQVSGAEIGACVRLGALQARMLTRPEGSDG